MILECGVMLADFFKDPVKGVNAQLMDLDVLPGDERPEPVAFIGDQWRDEEVARLTDPPAQPALYLTRDGAVVLGGDVQTIYRYGEGPIGLAARLITTEPSTCAADRQVEYYLRAIVKSIAAWLHNDEEARRDLNGVQVLGCQQIVWSPMKESVGNAVVTGAAAVSLLVRDENP